MGALGQQIVNGIMIGGIYSLLAAAVALIFGAMDIPDFALGQKAMVGGYVLFFAITSFGLNYWLGLLSAIALGFLIGPLSGLVFMPVRGSPVHGFIISLGLGIVLEAAAVLWWTFEFRRVPVPDYFSTVIEIPGGIRITGQRLVIVIASVLLMLILQLFLSRTRTGMAMRCVAQNAVGAQLVGVDIARVTLVTIGIGSALAAAAGGLIGSAFLVFPHMGNLLILKAFVVVILGGFGEVTGAMVGGYVLGLAESLGTHFVSPDFQHGYAFVILVLVLLLRPSGLFGKARAIGAAAQRPLTGGK